MYMNQEERRRKREQDTKKAKITFLIILIVIVAAAAIIAVTVTMLTKKNTPKADPVPSESLEGTEHTEEITDPVEPEIDAATRQAADFVAGMTLEDKVAQMFVITPNALTGFGGVTVAGETTKESYQNRPVGGLIYLSENLLDTEQTRDMLTKMNEMAKERTGLPVFLAVDEEGGSVARIAGNEAFGVTNVGDMSAIGATGDPQNAYNAGTVIATYLKSLGFNVDFAPVADVLTNPENTVIGKRSFGADSDMVSQMVTSELQGMADQGIHGTVKHFPGHGGTTGDSHKGAVTLEKTLEELTASELVPFQKAIDAGVSFVMAGHIALPNITGDNTPASLSQMMITNVLREQMGYDGIVITDGMNMGAITESYTSDQAAIMAVNAGVDMILMPEDYQTAYNGLLDAVKNGTITEERINQSVTRIVRVKQQMNQ